MSSKKIDKKLEEQQIQESLITSEMIQSLSLKMIQLQGWIQLKKQKIILVLEGNASPTKQQFIDQLQKNYDPSFIKYYNADKIRQEKIQWHFQPLIANLPETGQITIFDRCWHGDEIKEKISEIKGSTYESVTQMEQTLQTAGYQIIKYWFRAKTENFEQLAQSFIANSINVAERAFLDQLHIQSSNATILSIQHKQELPWHLVGGKNVIPTLNHFIGQINMQDMSFTKAVLPTPILENQTNVNWVKQKDNVIHLNEVNTNFPVAKEIQQAIEDYSRKGILKDSPIEGWSDFRKAAAKVMTQKKGLRCSPDQILPIDGATSGIYTIAQFAIRPDDEAIVFDPVDQSFKDAIESRGGKLVRVPLNPSTGKFSAKDLEQLVTSKTKMICLNNPHCLTGRVLRWNELLTIGQLAVKHQLWILNDESWSDIIYTPHYHFNIGSLHKNIAARTISINGFSKNFGLEDLSIGYIVTPNETVHRQLDRLLKMYSRGKGVSLLSQIAATAAYNDSWYWMEAFVDHLHNMRDFTTKRLNKIFSVKCNSPEGTYVLWIDITTFNMTAREMCDYLMKNAKVNVIPASQKWSGSIADNYIGICFSTSQKILSEGLDRIETSLTTLPRYLKLSKN